jgi:hypothetical protein
VSINNTHPSQERITDDDLQRHRRMLARLEEAQQLQQQAAQLQARSNDLFAAVRIWAEDLHERYALNPAIGEGVHPDGTITRKLTASELAHDTDAPSPADPPAPQQDSR